jgi:ribonucleoside-diphosphate reductase beta chain
MLLENAEHTYKPFKYPFAFEQWEKQQSMHWLPKEVPLGEDIVDWNNKTSPAERNLITQIFRFFTQTDIEVSNNYMTRLGGLFKRPEINMMLAAFANMETIHINAYSLLLDTLGMPETEYSMFMKYSEMKDKFDYFHEFKVNTKRDIAKTLAGFGAFIEGTAIFSSFIILLNFTRFNKFRGVGQIISWSIRDENLHAESIIWLFRQFINEHPRIWDDELKREIYEIAETTIRLEDAFIDLAFEQGAVQGLNAEDVKKYIRYVADRRLIELGMKPINGVKKNPLPWVDHLIGGAVLTNFFENRPTEYAKAATSGTWEDAFSATMPVRVPR